VETAAGFLIASEKRLRERSSTIFLSIHIQVFNSSPFIRPSRPFPRGTLTPFHIHATSPPAESIKPILCGIILGDDLSLERPTPNGNSRRKFVESL
jgi:hypothetical protein